MSALLMHRPLRNKALSPRLILCTTTRRSRMKGILLWLIGIPIPIIILLYLFVFR